MKKLIISLLLCSILFSPVFVKAEEVTPPQSEVTQQLIILLTEMIKMLQQQIADILASQELISSNLQIQNEYMGQIVTNTTPILYVKPEIINNPLSVTCSGTTLSFDEPNFEITFVANAKGGSNNYQYCWQSSNLTHTTDCKFSTGSEVSLSKNFLMANENTIVSTSKVYNCPKGGGFCNIPMSLNEVEKNEIYLSVIEKGMRVFVSDGLNDTSAYCPISISK